MGITFENNGHQSFSVHAIRCRVSTYFSLACSFLQLYETFESTDCFAVEANLIVSQHKLRFNFIHETKEFH